jgi:DNA polymerase III psi subunit
LNPSWSPLQREMLEAMGLSIHRAVGVVLPGELPDDPLIHALLRAAGRTRDAEDAARLAKAWPAPRTLRTDPRAKRALWPQLRALRRSPA